MRCVQAYHLVRILTNYILFGNFWPDCSATYQPASQPGSVFMVLKVDISMLRNTYSNVICYAAWEISPSRPVILNVNIERER